MTTSLDSTVLAIDRAPFLAALTGHPEAFRAALAHATDVAGRR